MADSHKDNKRARQEETGGPVGQPSGSSDVCGHVSLPPASSSGGAAATAAAAGQAVHTNPPVPSQMLYTDTLVYSSNLMGHDPHFCPHSVGSSPLEFLDGTPELRLMGRTLRASVESEEEEGPGATILAIPAGTKLHPAVVGAFSNKSCHHALSHKGLGSLLIFDIIHQAEGPGCGRAIRQYTSVADYNEAFLTLQEELVGDSRCAVTLKKKINKVAPALAAFGVDVEACPEEDVYHVIATAQVVYAAAQVTALSSRIPFSLLRSTYEDRKRKRMWEGARMFFNSLRMVSQHFPGIAFFSEVKEGMRVALTTCLGFLGYRRVDPPDTKHMSPSFLFYQPEVFELVEMTADAGASGSGSTTVDRFRELTRNALNPKSNWCTCFLHRATGTPFQFVGLHLDSNNSEAAAVLRTVRTINDVATAAIGDWNTTAKIKGAMETAVAEVWKDVHVVPTFEAGDETTHKGRAVSVQTRKIMLKDLFAKDLAAVSGGVRIVDLWRFAGDIVPSGSPPPILPNREWPSDHCGMIFQLRFPLPFGALESVPAALRCIGVVEKEDQ